MMKKRAPDLPEIFLHNRQRKNPLALGPLQDFAHAALPLCAAERGRGLTSLAQVDVVFISDWRMAQLHERFLRVSGPTDVITFQHGEIFISVETARRQARRETTSLGYELRLYLVHGLLHLQGFDDRAPAARRRMEERQEKIIRRLKTAGAAG